MKNFRSDKNNDRCSDLQKQMGTKHTVFFFLSVYDDKELFQQTIHRHWQNSTSWPHFNFCQKFKVWHYYGTTDRDSKNVPKSPNNKLKNILSNQISSSWKHTVSNFKAKQFSSFTKVNSQLTETNTELFPKIEVSH